MPRKLKLVLLLPFAGAMALAMVIFSPIRRIRLRQIGSARIGHFVTSVEAYLCKADAGILLTPASCVDVFYFEGYVCNAEVGRQWRERVRVLPFPDLAHLTARLLALWAPLAARHLVPAEAISLWGEANERAIHRHRGHLEVPAAAIREGGIFVSGNTQGKPLVCLHVRDSAYLRQTQPGRDYSYHDYRDWRAETLAPTVEELSESGYFLIRMGAVVDGSFPFVGQAVFDYSRSGLRSDAMDLFFSSRCAFWIGTASGLLDLPFVFRRPLVIVNHVSPLLPADPRITLYENSLWLFKKFWSKEKGRLLSFREIVENGVGGLTTGAQFAAAGIRFVDNSAEEIRDVTREMAARLNGTWVSNAEDEDRQRRFWEIWGPATHTRALAANARIGARFLSTNPDLLK